MWNLSGTDRFAQLVDSYSRFIPRLSSCFYRMWHFRTLVEKRTIFDWPKWLGKHFSRFSVLIFNADFFSQIGAEPVTEALPCEYCHRSFAGQLLRTHEVDNRQCLSGDRQTMDWLIRKTVHKILPIAAKLNEDLTQRFNQFTAHRRREANRVGSLRYERPASLIISLQRDAIVNVLSIRVSMLIEHMRQINQLVKCDDRTVQTFSEEHLLLNLSRSMRMKGGILLEEQALLITTTNVPAALLK